MPYTNPIIPGFYPDPSVCRVGEDYYLVTSTFEFFPGVPVFHSRDLVNWRQLGHCLTRPSQLPLAGAGCSAGIFAPTLRYHAGTFYMTTTNVSNYGNFYVTATDPAGPWSEPIRVAQGGIDPTIFFDDDGSAYYLSNAGHPDHPRGTISMARLDVATGQLQSAIRPIWQGTGGRYVEGPHLYRINGYYYLMCAEGGTEYGHMETIARSDSPWGPYTACPHNPILSHRDEGGSSIQGTGHADLVQAHDGSWWLVFLAFRQAHFMTHHLGRETFLAPVQWDAAGWPVVNGHGTVTLTMDVPTLPLQPWPAAPVRDDFAAPALGLVWNHLRNPDPADYSLTARPGWLRLQGNACTLNTNDAPAFVGRRQQHFACRAATCLDFNPTREGDEAGLTVLMGNQHHYEVAVVHAGNVRRVIVRRRLGSLVAVTVRATLAPGPVALQVTADQAQYTFACRQGDGAWLTLDTGEARYLSSEVAGGFTGVYLGLYATGNGAAASAPADFDWFDYVVLPPAKS